MKKQTSRNVPLKIMAIAAGIALLMLLLLAAAIWLFWHYTGQLQDSMFQTQAPASAELLPSPSPSPTPPPGFSVTPDWIDEDGNAYLYRDDVIAVLLMGIDYMSDEQYWDDGIEFNGGNADALALAILDTNDHSMSLLYIPRDTMADLLMLDPDGNYLDIVHTNISAAHSYGDGGALSCELTVDAVSRLLNGIPIQRYAALRYDAIDEINQLLGGVEITLEEDLTGIDPSFTAGSTVTLTNEQLRHFVLKRGSDLDSAFDRGLRHMDLLEAMFSQCKAAFKEDIYFPVQLYNSAIEYVSTNLTLSEASYLARQVFSADFSSIPIITLEGELTMGEKYAEYYPDAEWLHDFVVDTFCEPIE